MNTVVRNQLTDWLTECEIERMFVKCSECIRLFCHSFSCFYYYFFFYFLLYRVRMPDFLYILYFSWLFFRHFIIHSFYHDHRFYAIWTRPFKSTHIVTLSSFFGSILPFCSFAYKVFIGWLCCATFVCIQWPIIFEIENKGAHNDMVLILPRYGVCVCVCVTFIRCTTFT